MKIIRWPNLLIIFLTQLLFQFTIIQPLIQGIHASTSASLFDFIIIACIYQLLAAAGYIINDYFDLPIDEVNKPDKVFIGNGISKSGAMASYIVMNLLALAMAGIISNKHGNNLLVVCVAVSEVLLFAYSAIFKKKFLIGNVIVAVITASAIPVLVLTEPSLEGALLSHVTSAQFRLIMNVTLIYTCFAVMISFARELIKDLEDVKGDDAYGARTIPIVLGARGAQLVVTISLVGVITGVAFIQMALWQQGVLGCRLLSVYALLLITFPLLWIIRKLFKTEAAEGYHQLSSYMKMVTLTGILSMVFIQFLLK